MKTITSFQVHENSCAMLFSADGSNLRINFNAKTGKLLSRKKIGSFSNIQHTGIYLGTDTFGREYVMHNHYHWGRSILDTLENYASGQSVTYAPCTNQPSEVVKKALQHILEGKNYHFLANNCQIVAYDACHNKKQSPDVEKWVLLGLSGAALLGGLSYLAFGGKSKK